MKHRIARPNPPICTEAEVAQWKREVFRPSQAWRRKMVVLEEIHREISPQLELMIASRDEILLPDILREVERR